MVELGLEVLQLQLVVGGFCLVFLSIDDELLQVSAHRGESFIDLYNFNLFMLQPLVKTGCKCFLQFTREKDAGSEDLLILDDEINGM